MDANQIYAGNYLRAEDLAGQEFSVIISKVEVKEFEDRKGNKQPKIVLNFIKAKKGMVVNKTNAKRIISMYGPDTNQWIGNEITLFTDQVEMDGDLVDAIRIRLIKQTALTKPKTPELPRPTRVYNDTDMEPSEDIPF